MLRIRYLSLYIYDCDNGEMKAANLSGGKKEKRSKKSEWRGWEKTFERKRAFRLKFYSRFKNENFSSNEDDNDDDASIKMMML